MCLGNVSYNLFTQMFTCFSCARQNVTEKMEIIAGELPICHFLQVYATLIWLLFHNWEWVPISGVFFRLTCVTTLLTPSKVFQAAYQQGDNCAVFRCPHKLNLIFQLPLDSDSRSYVSVALFNNCCSVAIECVCPFSVVIAMYFWSMLRTHSKVWQWIH